MFLPGKQATDQDWIYAPSTNFVHAAAVDRSHNPYIGFEGAYPATAFSFQNNVPFAASAAILSGTPNVRSNIAESVVEFDIAGTIVISIRRVSEEITNVETEKFEVTQVGSANPQSF